MAEKLEGKIVKGIAGFYYVYVNEKGLFECKAKGLFRREKIKPLVGDDVSIGVIDHEKHLGNIEDIFPRKNEIIRPACANIDMAVIVMSISKPALKPQLLDKIMVFFEYYDVPVTLCFNKIDEAEEADISNIADRYRGSGCDIIWVSAKTREGLDVLKKILRNRTSILMGPSGVGKSSILNCLDPKAASDVGDISRIGRGRHTTRHTEIFSLGEDTFLYDTPGFTSIDIPDIPKERIKYYFAEFSGFEGKCKFHECVHINEPSCAVKEAVEKGNVNKDRYESYRLLYDQLKERKEY